MQLVKKLSFQAPYTNTTAACFIISINKAVICRNKINNINNWRLGCAKVIKLLRFERNIKIIKIISRHSTLKSVHFAISNVHIVQTLAALLFKKVKNMHSRGLSPREKDMAVRPPFCPRSGPSCDWNRDLFFCC